MFRQMPDHSRPRILFTLALLWKHHTGRLADSHEGNEDAMREFLFQTVSQRTKISHSILFSVLPIAFKSPVI
jgi:hypothetical protein